MLHASHRYSYIGTASTIMVRVQPRLSAPGSRSGRQAAPNKPGHAQDSQDDCSRPCDRGNLGGTEVAPSEQCVEEEHGAGDVSEAVNPAPGQRLNLPAQPSGDRDQDKDVEGQGTKTDRERPVVDPERNYQVDRPDRRLDAA